MTRTTAIAVPIGLGALLGIASAVAGAAWTRTDGRWRVAGVGMLAGGFLADAAFRLMSIAPFDGVDPWATTIQVLVVDVQVAAAMPAALLMRGSRTVGYLASVALAAGGVAALKVVEVAHRAMIGG